MSDNEVTAKEFIDYSTVGKRVRQLRIDNAMTQQELADKIDKSITFINKLESNNTSMSLNSLIALTKALNTSMDFLLFESLPKEKSITDVQIDLILKELNEADKDLALDILRTIKKHKR